MEASVFTACSFGEAFHNSAGAASEAQAKFVGPAELERFRGGEPLQILDVCLGLGYNTAAVLGALTNTGTCRELVGTGNGSSPPRARFGAAQFSSPLV
jgi:hypothetical protein